MKTKGELEAAISQAVVRFEKEFLGRGPVETRTYLVDDMALVRLRNVLTPAEIKLVEVEDPGHGRDRVKALRRQLFEQGRSMKEAAIRDITGAAVVSMHTDVGTRTGERVIVFTPVGPPQCRIG